MQRHTMVVGNERTADNCRERSTTGGAGAIAAETQPWFKQVPTLTSHEPTRVFPPPPPPPSPPRSSGSGVPDSTGLNWFALDDWLERGQPISEQRAAGRRAPTASGGGRGRASQQRMDWLQTIPERNPGAGNGGSNGYKLNNLDIDQPNWSLDTPQLLSGAAPAGNGGRLLDNDLFVPISPLTNNGGEHGPLYGEEEDLRRAIELSLLESQSQQGQWELQSQLATVSDVSKLCQQFMIR